MDALADFKDTLRERAALRDDLAAKLEELRARIDANATEKAAADTAADEAHSRYIDVLGAHTLGERVDLSGAKRARDKATDALDVLVDLGQALQRRCDSLEDDVDVATRDAAHALEALAVARAEQLREEYRQAIDVLGAYAGRYFGMCKAASQARHVATGNVGDEPVAFTPPRAALLVGVEGIYDLGIPAVLERHGISPNLQPLVGLLVAPTEAELLGDDHDHNNGGAALNATEAA